MSDPLERASPAAIAAHQLERLSRLLGEVLPGNGLQLMRETGATVLVCTVTYALRLAEAAGELGIDLPALGIPLLVRQRVR